MSLLAAGVVVVTAGPKVHTTGVNWNLVGAIGTVVATLMAAAGVIYHWFQVKFIAPRDELNRVRLAERAVAATKQATSDVLAQVQAELRNNGGFSFKDAIDRQFAQLNERITSITAHLGRQDERINGLYANRRSTDPTEPDPTK